MEIMQVKTGRIGDRPLWAMRLSILVRAFHQVGAALFLAVYFLDVVPQPSVTVILLAGVSGVLLLVLEYRRHPQIFREFAGIVTIIKVALAGAVFHGFMPQQEIILLAFVLASIGTHAPKHIRHRLLI